jgi:hypothetical protein
MQAGGSGVPLPIRPPAALDDAAGRRRSWPSICASSQGSFLPETRSPFDDATRLKAAVETILGPGRIHRKISESKKPFEAGSPVRGFDGSMSK